VIEAVIFDLDGVILETEQVWDEVREGLVRERGGRWSERAQADMMGMSSTEWSAYMHDVVGLAESPEEISTEVVRRMLARYEAGLPLVDGAVEAVRRVAARWPLGLASSSNRELIDRALRCSRDWLDAGRDLSPRPETNLSLHKHRAGSDRTVWPSDSFPPSEEARR
jgi:beta-phosphoglucomutase-like phosphatase (HAD superfamily)